jgi:hypothetical protein
MVTIITLRLRQNSLLNSTRGLKYKLQNACAECLTITDKIFKKNSRKFQACKACDIARLDYLFSILGESL